MKTVRFVAWGVLLYVFHVYLARIVNSAILRENDLLKRMIIIVLRNLVFYLVEQPE